MRNSAYLPLVLGCIFGVSLAFPISSKAEEKANDPASVAKAILTAYKGKDLESLSTLSNENNKGIISELAKAGESHPRYKSIFQGWRWDAVKGWDGKIHGTRYRNKNEAAVHFADMEGDEIAVVVLTWEEGKWLFEDINSPDKASFEEGSVERPE